MDMGLLDRGGFSQLSAHDFESYALGLFKLQAMQNPVYAEWIRLMGIQSDTIDRLENIPFLPISFFKSHQVITGAITPSMVFESSGTTADVKSHHFVKDIFLYEQSFLQAFQIFYGEPSNYCILGLLPSYLERSNSSLVYMVDRIIKESNNPMSGFYLADFKKLESTLLTLEEKGQPTILIGVSFALIDFAEASNIQLKNTIVMETGGMKGRKKELTKWALHDFLSKKWGIEKIHSEYGMTELLSQAYSRGEGIYHCPPWMKVMVAEEEDPTQIKSEGGGVLQIIDLANRHSCGFIATEDIGYVHPDGSFEVHGRLALSERRGCSLLVV